VETPKYQVGKSWVTPEKLRSQEGKQLQRSGGKVFKTVQELGETVTSFAATKIINDRKKSVLGTNDQRGPLISF